MNHSLGDDAAVAAALGGDAESFGVLVERYEEVAFRAAYLVVRDAASAQDVAQEGFVRARRHLDRFKRGEPFRPWLLRIVRNLALNEVRARGRREGLLARLGRFRTEAEAEPGPELSSERAERSGIVLRAMEQLSSDDRHVLQLRYFLDLPEREIATVIGKRPGTVKSRLSRASRRLRAVIERDFPELRPEETARGADGG